MKRFQHTLAPVDTVSALENMLIHSDYAVVDGETVGVKSLRAMFVYRRGSGASADGITIVASAYGDGVWERLAAYTDDSWLLQDTWYINTVTGSDEQGGNTAGTPIKTWAELRRRVGNGNFKQATLIVLQTDLPSSDPMIVDFGCEGQLTVFGSTTIVESRALVSVTARAPVSNAVGNVVTGVTNFTPYVSRSYMLYMSDGPAAGAGAWVLKATGGGGVVGEVSSWVKSNNSEAVPVIGNLMLVVGLCNVAKAYLDSRLSIAGGLVVENVEFGTAPALVLRGMPMDTPPTFVNCSFGVAALAAEQSTAVFTNCRFAGITASACLWILYGGATFGDAAFTNNTYAELRLGFIGQDGSIQGHSNSYLNVLDAAVKITQTSGFLLGTGAKGLAAIVWGIASGPGSIGCTIGVSSQLESTTANTRYIIGTGVGNLKIGTLAAGAWPAAAGVLTADPASLAAFMHG